MISPVACTGAWSRFAPAATLPPASICSPYQRAHWASVRPLFSGRLDVASQRHELDTLASRQLGQSMAEHQALEMLRLLVGLKGAFVHIQLVEEKDPVIGRRCGQTKSVPGSDFTALAMLRRMSATASASPSLASQVTARAS